MKARIIRILGILLIAAGAIGITVSNTASSSLIVSIGVRALATLHTIAGITLGAGAAALIGGCVPAAVKFIQQRTNVKLLESSKESEQKTFDEYAKDSLNPERTRIRLNQILKNTPKLGGLVYRCLEQMDRMDKYQVKLQSLIDANEAIYLNDTVAVLDQSEKRMCQNMRNIINSCILIEGTDEDESSLDQSIVSKSLQNNEDELEAVQTLLKYSVAYINNYNCNGINDRSELDAWLKIMKSSTEEK